MGMNFEQRIGKSAIMDSSHYHRPVPVGIFIKLTFLCCILIVICGSVEPNPRPEPSLSHISDALQRMETKLEDLLRRNNSKHHPCDGRPCDAGHTWVAVEAAPSVIYLTAPVAATACTTLPPTTSATPTTTTTTTQPRCRYKGCYLDDGHRMLKNIWVDNSVMTQEWCMAKCREDNYKFAALQYYTHCFCGNSYDGTRYTKKADSECNTPCRGNPQQMCGGAWRMSVYTCR